MSPADWPDPPVGTRVRHAHPPGEVGDLGHVVAVFDHGGARQYVIAVWGPRKQRWFYYVEIGYVFVCGLWMIEATPGRRG